MKICAFDYSGAVLSLCLRIPSPDVSSISHKFSTSPLPEIWEKLKFWTFQIIAKACKTNRQGEKDQPVWKFVWKIDTTARPNDNEETI